MKTKILNEAHYNYANSICQIIGFSNVFDYTTQISYTILKNNTLAITIKINETFTQFKKLFELKYFNLSRLKYKIENTSQIWAFVKKLFKYMNVPFDIVRKNKDIKMRLINKNNLSINTINKMAHIEQYNTKNINCQENIIREKIPKIMFSEILKKYKMKSYEKTYYIKSNFNFDAIINDFEYFNFIQILNIDYPINIKYEIGCTDMNEEHFNNSDNKNYKFIINFPNNTFFKYHIPKISLIHENQSTTFKIIVNGFKFKPTIINYDKYIIEFDHEPKYFLFEHVNLHSLSGMLGIKYAGFLTKEALEYTINNEQPEISYTLFTHLNQLISNKLLTEKEFIFDNLKYNLITINDNNFLYDNIKLLHFYPNFISNGNSFQLSNVIYDDYIICLITNNTIQFEYSILNDDNTLSIYYEIKKTCDLLNCMQFINKFELSDNDEIKIEIFCKKKYFIGIFNNKNLNEQINFTHFYNMLNYYYLYLIITIDEKYFDNFKELNINFGNVYANSHFRKKLHDNYPFIIK